MYLCLIVLGLCRCTGFTLVAASGATLVEVCGLLLAVSSFVVQHRLEGM